MSKLSISLEWFLQEDELKPDVFSKNHKIEINNNYFNAGSAPEYGGKENELNPEQSLAAAISSCHMMTFLALAAKTKWPVSSYKDHAVGHLGKNSKKQMVVNRIDLNPVVSFDAGFEVSSDELDKMHDRAHRYCFIANTLDSEVEVSINI